MFMELLPGGELFDRIPIGVGLHVQQMFIYYSQVKKAFMRKLCFLPKVLVVLSSSNRVYHYNHKLK
ncbi:unnamed protein product [Trichobilharzia regenti]|nr:unnamed protein product [Trichobilharzia regenti]